MPNELLTPAAPPVTGGVLGERLSSPGLLLALLGRVAMRRLRDVHTAHHLAPRQFRLLALLHDRGPIAQSEAEDALFGALDHEQREQLRQLLTVVQESLTCPQEPSCSLVADYDLDAGAADTARKGAT